MALNSRAGEETVVSITLPVSEQEETQQAAGSRQVKTDTERRRRGETENTRH
jgi:hypothetical protein